MNSRRVCGSLDQPQEAATATFARERLLAVISESASGVAGRLIKAHADVDR
jgi:hypothetical protein